MPEYLSPGVYIEEQDSGPEPIEGVSTSVTGFVGVTQSGPFDTLPPVLVTSFPQFAQIFGSYFTPNFSGTPSSLAGPWAYNLLPHAVAGFFNNGGSQLYIKRIAAGGTPPFTLISAAIVNGVPAAYQMGDVLAVQGGTFTVQATITITGVSAGVINSIIFTPGTYSVAPPSPNTPLPGSKSGASGATFNLTTSGASPDIILASVNIKVASAAYQVSDVLTISGGTGTAAEIQVTGVTGGVITSVMVALGGAGNYNINPPLTPNQPGLGSVSGAWGATFNLTMSPSVPLAATSSEGLQNNVTNPQIVTRLTSSVFSNSLILPLQSLRGIDGSSTITLTQVQNGLTSVAFAPVQSYNDATGLVTLQSALAPVAPSATVPATFYSQYTTVSVSAGGAFNVAANGPPDVVPPSFALSAIYPGMWGNSIQLQIQPSSRATAQVLSLGSSVPGTFDMVVLNSAANFYNGAIVEFNTGSTKVYGKVINLSTNSIQVSANPPFAAGTLNHAGSSPTTARTCEFNVTASYGTVSENFPSLTLDNTTPYYYATTINNDSSLLAVPPSPLGSTNPYPCDNTTTDPSTLPMAIDGLNVPMAAGTDGSYPAPNDYIGNDGGPGNRTGLAALVDVDQISIIAAPGVVDPATQGALITQCETLKYRFAILDPAPIVPSSASNLTAIQNQRIQFDTEYAAIYFPSVIVDDPLTGNNLIIPPSGHVAGIYAQTDDSRGVWKAPANVVINGILDLEVKLSKGDQDVLNPEPNNINALRDFTAQGRGLRVYGARCITSDTEWMYVNVRRLFIFLESSLDEGTQWAVFEPNDQVLWNRLIQSVSSFLTSIWREGGLMGATADQAFFVKCGYDTMSSDDMENGRLIMLVGVAPVYPAEFVIIRIGQWAGGSSVQEL